jgi:hypothetical protein
VVALTEHVCAQWNQVSSGVWESRLEQRHYTYSKVLCWVALDRTVRLATKRGLPGDVARWQRIRNEIYIDIQSHAWNESLGAFTQSYNAPQLDASVLIMPLLFFCSPADPRFRSTLDLLLRPVREGGLSAASTIFRYLTVQEQEEQPAEADTAKKHSGDVFSSVSSVVEKSNKSGSRAGAGEDLAPRRETPRKDRPNAAAAAAPPAITSLDGPTLPVEAEGTFSMCSFWAVECMARLGQSEPAYLQRAEGTFTHLLVLLRHARCLGCTGGGIVLRNVLE